ncbi:thrombomodulin-like [Polypterus senegalus]
MKKPAAGILIALQLALLAAGQQQRKMFCFVDSCYSVHEEATDFPTARAACDAYGGHLMTMRYMPADFLRSLSGEVQKRSFWIGLYLPKGRCVDDLKKLRGFQWVTGGESTEFSNWKETPFTCEESCVSVSEEVRWQQRSCLAKADGFWCEYNYSRACNPQVLQNASFQYAVEPTKELMAVPLGTVGLLSTGYKYYCANRSNGNAEWLQAPWSCQHELGGCSHGCEMEGSQPKCICPEGQLLHENRVTCEIPDPCRGNPCEHICVPEWDSYSCLCREGYTLDKGGSKCRDVDECKKGQVCHPSQVCTNTPGSYQCVCRTGFELVDGKCEDVDECSSAPCEQECQNTAGGYQCSCFEGHAQNAKGDCVVYCNSSQCPPECDPNFPDSCTCPNGYIIDDMNGSYVCLDIQECDSPTYCDQLCNNTYGSYICSCYDGFQLHSDGFNCFPIDDEGSGFTTLPTVFTVTATPTANVTMEKVILPSVLLGIIACVLMVTVLVTLLVIYIVKRKRKQHASLYSKDDS